MGVIKNEVGRPTNKSIMIRRILKLILLLVIVAGVFCAGYYYKDKKDNNKKEEKNVFVKDKLYSVKQENSDGIDIYVYDKLLEFDAPITEMKNVKVIDDIAVFELYGIDTSLLVVVNNKGKILGTYNYDSSHEKYKIENKKIIFSSNNFMDVCDEKDDEVVQITNQLTYKNGKINEKVLSSLNKKEFINKYNVKCN